MEFQRWEIIYSDLLVLPKKTQKPLKIELPTIIQRERFVNISASRTLGNNIYEINVTVQWALTFAPCLLY